MNKKLSFIVILSFLSSCVLADDFGIYTGINNHKSLYKNIKNDIEVIFDIAYRINDEKKDEPLLFYYDLVVATNHSGYEARDSDMFNGMDKRKMSIDIGVQMTMDFDLFPITLEATKDIYGSKGFESMFKLGGISPTSDEDWKIQPSIGLYYQSSKVTSYYFGVKESEITENRGFYKGKSALTPFIGIELEKDFGQYFTLTSGINYELRNKEIKNSPLTDGKNHDLMWNAGLVYWF